MKIDFHIHSKNSSDSFMSVDGIVRTAKKRGLDGVAIVDHNNLPDVKKKYKDFMVIKGEEVLTRGGEIIALGIEKKIPKFKSIKRTVELIKKQGGTIVIPHPFAFWRKGVFLGFKKIKSPFVFEAINGMAYFPFENYMASKYAQDHKMPVCAGSDAHRYKDIGNAYTVLPDATSIDDVLRNLLAGKGVPVGNKGSNWVNIHVLLKSMTRPIINPFFKRFSQTE